MSSVPRPRLHVISLPHTETTREYDWCAFTAKTRKFVTMMTSIGYDVRLYAGEANEAVCTEHIPILSRAEQKKWFGHYDWSRDVFNEFDSSLEWWRVMNARAAEEIRKRAQPGDILGLVMGYPQRAIVDALKDIELYEVEIGIGYTGPSSPFRVFESYALRHFLADRVPYDNVRPFDVVIPNFFEIDAFPEGNGDGNYYLFLGRATQRKGPSIAAEVCRQIGAKLLVAGQGIARTDPVTTTEGIVFEGNVEYVGVANPEKRAKLMGGAKAVFLPTIYLEPFGGVAVEAMICGTPVITSDWGAFTETVIDGVTGFRCHTIREYVEAARRVGELDRKAIRKYAISRYSTEVIAPQYDRYFKRLSVDYPEFVENERNKQRLDIIEKEKKAANNRTPENFIDLSVNYYHAKRFRDCIAAAVEVLKLKPDYADAYNNIAAAHLALGEFDLAVAAADEALRITPNLQLAINNRAAAIADKAKMAASNAITKPFEGSSVRLVEGRYLTSAKPEEQHLGGNIPDGDSWTFYPEMWDYLAKTYNVKRYLDLGCGDGVALKYWKDVLHVEGVGIDGLRHNVLKTREKGITCYEYDFESRKPFTEDIGRFDLCWSCEFVEHVEERFVDRILALMSKANYVAMTHALPGQAGYHHVNCQPPEYWIGLLERNGFHYDAEATAILRSKAHAHFANSGLFFKRMDLVIKEGRM
jgi:glycosyltransferase involved in cell wall biosynthesis/predicted TPR repeat methyltransferase